MEVYELREKEFKITIIKMLNKLREMIHEQNENFKKKRQNTEPNKNFGAEEYSNWNKKLTRGVQQQHSQSK